MASGNIGKTDQVNKIKMQPISQDNEVVTQTVQITLPSTRTPNDVYSILLLPADHLPVDLIVATEDLDTGTSLTLSFGLLNSTQDDISAAAADGGAAWIASSTVGQAGGLVRPTTNVMFTVTNNATTDRVFGVKTVLNGSATAGKVWVTLSYRRARFGV